MPESDTSCTLRALRRFSANKRSTYPEPPMRKSKKHVRVVTSREVASFDESEVLRVYPGDGTKLGEGYLSSAAFRELPPKMQDPYAAKQFDLHFADGRIARGCQLSRGQFGDGAAFTFMRLEMPT
jgi:hypothetical protein